MLQITLTNACFIGLLLIASAVSADTPKPVIENDQVIFINNKVLAVKANQIVHSEPLEAYRNHEPIRFRERAVLIEGWQRVIVNKHMNYFEGPRSEIRVYDYEGKLLNPATQFRGKAMIIGPTNRIFLGQFSRSYKIDKSLLLDQNGKLVAEVTQLDDAFEFSLSKDGKLIVIYARDIQNGQTAKIAKVVDFNGRDVRTLDVSQVTSIDIEHEGQKYQLAVPGATKKPMAKPATK